MTEILASARRWIRSRVVSLMALAILALGIGANLALTSVWIAVEHRPLPVSSPERLVVLSTSRGPRSLSAEAWRFFNFEQQIFESTAAAGAADIALDQEGLTRNVQALYVSGGFFETIGTRTSAGRSLLTEDDRQGAPLVAVLDYAFCKREFGAERNAVGARIMLGGQLVTVVGVADSQFFGVEVGRRVDVFLPIAAEPIVQGVSSRLRRGHVQWLTIFGRLRPRQTIEQAGAALKSFEPSIRQASESESSERRRPGDELSITSARTGLSTLRQRVSDALPILLCGAGLVLLVACVNLGGLMLARYTDRRQEIGLRRVLGATRSRLILGLLADSLVLTTAGAVVGVAVAIELTSAITPMLQSTLDRSAPYLRLGIDPLMIVAAAAFAVVTGLLVGLLPAIRSTSEAALNLALASQNRVSSAGTVRWLRAMACVQIALSLVLVSGAGILIQSFIRISAQPTAVDGDRVLLASIAGPLFSDDAVSNMGRIDALVEALNTIPGAEATSASTMTPLSGLIMLVRVDVPGLAGLDARHSNVAVNQVTKDFFKVFGTPILAGRSFDDRDTRGAVRTAVVNQAFVDLYLAPGNAIGALFRLNEVVVEVVGIVANGKYMNVSEPIRPFVYVPLSQWIVGRPQPVRLAVRAYHPSEMVGPVLQNVRRVNRNYSLEFRTLDDERRASGNRERMLAWIGATLASLALMISAAGIHGVMAYSVIRRRAEISVRLALGATASVIVRMVLREAIGTTVVGLGLGCALCVISVRALRAQLVDVGGIDAATLILSVATLGAVGIASSILPARAATLRPPLEGLR